MLQIYVQVDSRLFPWNISLTHCVLITYLQQERENKHVWPEQGTGTRSLETASLCPTPWEIRMEMSSFLVCTRLRCMYWG